MELENTLKKGSRLSEKDSADKWGKTRHNWINDGGQNKGSKAKSEGQGMSNFQNKTGKAIHENT